MTESPPPGWESIRRGKVRDVYASGDRVLLVASDRLTVFDCVLPDPIPGKGEVLTQLSAFWFQRLDFVPNHFITADVAAFPEGLRSWAGQLSGRVMLCRKAQPLPVAGVVRGYLAGAAWDEYRATGTAGGHELPRGLRESSKLPEPLFTPAVKRADGTMELVGWDQCRRLLGDEIAHAVRSASFEIYEHGCAQASRAGVIIADTKFKFGLRDEQLLLIDECLTPDSSRFWPADQWEPGVHPPSFDKQFVRDWLVASGWNRQSPAPALPPEIIAQTAAKYRDVYERLLLARRPA
jgi:phosphoribosylaminoimidazole-succinocarboxamide synthase